MDNAVCIAVYYKMFSGSKKQKIFAKTEMLVVRHISFPLAQNQGPFSWTLLQCPGKSCVWWSTDKEVYNIEEFDLQKGM